MRWRKEAAVPIEMIRFGWVTLAVAALQLAAAPCCFALLPRRPRRELAIRELRLEALPAVGVAVLLAFPAWLTAGRGAPSLSAAVVLALTLGGSLSAGGIRVGLRAGRLEAAGRLRPARRLALEGGRAAFRGNLALVVLVTLLGVTSSTDPSGQLWLGAGAFLAAGVLALLGGLTGKPRPSFKFATVLQLAALALTLHGAGATLWA